MYGRRGMCGRGTCVVRGASMEGAMCAGGLCVKGRVVYMAGSAWQGAGGVWLGACMVGDVNAGETATEAGSKHPTGMHSCLHFHAVLSKTLAK